MHIPLNRLGIEWNPCEQGKGRIRFYNVETEKADRSLRKSAGAVEGWWYDSKVDDLALTIWLYYALCYALIDGVDRTLINTQLTDRVGKIRHHEANDFALPFMFLPTYYPPHFQQGRPIVRRAGVATYSEDAAWEQLELKEHAC